MLNAAMLPRPARPPHPPAPRWQQLLFWASLAVLLHVVALYVLGQAFTAIKPEALPQPMFARLLLPTAKPPAPANPEPEHQRRAEALSPREGNGMQVSTQAPTQRTSAPTPVASNPRRRTAEAGAPFNNLTHPDARQSDVALPATPPSEPLPQAHSLSDEGVAGQVAVSGMTKEVALPNRAASQADHFAKARPGQDRPAGVQTAPQTTTTSPQPAHAGSTTIPSARAPAQTTERPAPAASAATQQPDADGWPPSTQLRFALTGNYRGPLHGSGALVWVRDGTNYRVELSGSALVSFAYTSTGQIDQNWLAPDRYVERVFTRHKEVFFNRDQDTLSFSAIGSVMPLPTHLQDSASIFMQLAHLLTTEPANFKTGQTLAFEVARPSGTTTWDFTIAGQETILTGLGPLLCWHLDHAGSNDELGADVWLAPALQNLPVQIRLQQDADTYLLFTLSEARQQ